MKKVTIEIEVVNSAFKDGMSYELSRILGELAKELEYGHLPRFLSDINGNKVGEVKIEY